jgi:hypothetical protein
MNLKKFMPPWAMINGICTSTMLVVVLFLISAVAFANPVALGTFGDDDYAYEDSTVLKYENIDIVWVATPSQKFNVNHSKNYGGAAGRIAIDCSGHTSLIMEVIIFDVNGKTIGEHKVPQDKWEFLPIQEHTIEYSLYRDLCVEHPNI